MAFTDLNKIGMGQLLPLVKLTFLDKTQFYPITKIFTVKTRFGSRIMVNICGTHAAYLPERLAKHVGSKPRTLEKMQRFAMNGTLFMHVVGGEYNHCQFTEDADEWVSMGLKKAKKLDEDAIKLLQEKWEKEVEKTIEKSQLMVGMDSDSE